MKYRKALVTGGAGFIGSHIVERLVDMGIETIVIDDLSMGRRENVSKKAKLIVGNILESNALKKAMKEVDIVFHNAAKVSIRNSFSDFHNDTNVNVMGTINILQAMAENKVKKIIYASSMAVYGKNFLPIKENGLLDPISPYGVGKLASERYCLLMGKFYHFDVVCLRYFNTHGTRQTFTPYVGVITIFITRLLKNKSPIIFGDGNQVRDFIHVSDIVEANVLAMEKEITGEVLNVGTGNGIDVNEIARILINKINPKIKPRYTAPRPGEPADSIADISKAKEIIGFKALSRLEDNIDEVIDWLRKCKTPVEAV